MRVSHVLQRGQPAPDQAHRRRRGRPPCASAHGRRRQPFRRLPCRCGRTLGRCHPGPARRARALRLLRGAGRSLRRDRRRRAGPRLLWSDRGGVSARCRLRLRRAHPAYDLVRAPGRRHRRRRGAAREPWGAPALQHRLLLRRQGVAAAQQPARTRHGRRDRFLRLAGRPLPQRHTRPHRTRGRLPHAGPGHLRRRRREDPGSASGGVRGRSFGGGRVTSGAHASKALRTRSSIADRRRTPTPRHGRGRPCSSCSAGTRTGSRSRRPFPPARRSWSRRHPGRGAPWSAGVAYGPRG